MANEEKLAKFHQAINHYAMEQREKIEQEVAAFKKKELEEASNEVLAEAYHLIQKEMAQMRGRISREMARREMDGRRALLTVLQLNGNYDKRWEAMKLKGLKKDGRYFCPQTGKKSLPRT